MQILKRNKNDTYVVELTGEEIRSIRFSTCSDYLFLKDENTKSWRSDDMRFIYIDKLKSAKLYKSFINVFFIDNSNYKNYLKIIKPLCFDYYKFNKNIIDDGDFVHCVNKFYVKYNMNIGRDFDFMKVINLYGWNKEFDKKLGV